MVEGDYLLSVFVLRKPFCNAALNSYLRLKELRIGHQQIIPKWKRGEDVAFLALNG